MEPGWGSVSGGDGVLSAPGRLPAPHTLPSCPGGAGGLWVGGEMWFVAAQNQSLPGASPPQPFPWRHRPQQQGCQAPTLVTAGLSLLPHLLQIGDFSRDPIPTARTAGLTHACAEGRASVDKVTGRLPGGKARAQAPIWLGQDPHRAPPSSATWVAAGDHTMETALPSPGCPQPEDIGPSPKAGGAGTDGSRRRATGCSKPTSLQGPSRQWPLAPHPGAPEGAAGEACVCPLRHCAPGGVSGALARQSHSGCGWRSTVPSPRPVPSPVLFPQ